MLNKSLLINEFDLGIYHMTSNLDQCVLFDSREYLTGHGAHLLFHNPSVLLLVYKF